MTNAIAFQGEAGAFSHLACVSARPDLTPLARPTFEDALAAVEEGDAVAAMIPLENSVAGRVADIHHLLPESPLHLTAEHFEPVSHCLLGPPGATLESVRFAHSHAMALAQCRGFLRRTKIMPARALDTAGAAREIAERADPAHAAVASRLAAQTYGLDVISPDIHDDPHNTTRFVIMAREPNGSDDAAQDWVTSFLFRVRNAPAALYKALGGFATEGLNLTKLESYQLEGTFTAAQFFADVEGDPNAPAMARAFDELAYFCEWVRVAGRYRAHPERFARREGLREASSG